MTIKTPTFNLSATLLIMGLLAISPQAVAYVGPGSGLSIIGSLLAFIAAIFVAIFGFIWFPIRRRLRKRKLAQAQMSDDSQGQSGSTASDTPEVTEADRAKSEA